MKVYVYGTLRKGGHFHSALENAKFIEKGFVTGFKMVDLGSFPAAIESKANSIYCEQYEIDQAILNELDRIEGYPSLYDRVEVNGSYLYVIHPWNTSNAKEIEGGDWMKYINERNNI